MSPPMSCMPFFGLRTTAQMSLAARFTAGTTLPRIFGMKSTTPIERGDDARSMPRLALPLLLAGVDAGRGERRGGEEQDHLDGAADTGAQHHRAPGGRDGHVLVVQVVDLERGPADAVGRDEVEERARELGEPRRTERQVLVDAAHERGRPRHRHQGVEHEREHGPSPGRVLELLLERLPVDALEARDRDREREQDAGEHPDVDQAEALDLQRRDVLGAGRGGEVGAQLLERSSRGASARARRAAAARPVARTG